MMTRLSRQDRPVPNTSPRRLRVSSSDARRFSRTPIATAVAVALYLKQPLPLYAADAAATDQPNLEEVLVTGTRRAENIQDTPYSIAAVDSEIIQQLHLNSMDDIGHWVPGVTVQAQGNVGPSNIITRGLNVVSLGASGAGPNGVGGAVATYLGEIPLFVDFRTLDIDRVEALMGPQGTLYGAGTLGGIIRFIPKAPNLSNFEADAHVRLTWQDHASPQGGYDGDAVFNLPLIDGVLGFRAAVGYYHDPGFINDTRLLRVPGVSNPQPNFSDPNDVAANLHTEKGVNFDHTLTARAMLLFKPNDGFDAELTYMHQRTTTHGVQVTDQPTVDTGPFDHATRILENSDRSADLTALVMTGHLGFADLVSASTFSSRRLQRTRDTTDGFLSYSSYSNFPTFVAYDVSDFKTDQFTQELRLVSPGNSRVTYILGAFYQYFRDDSKDYEYAPGFPAYLGVDRPDQLNDYSAFKRYSTDKAVFGELGYHFTPAWQVTVGARWFQDSQTQDNFVSPVLMSGDLPPVDIPVKERHITAPAFSTTLYKFNTSYRFTPDLMIYANVADGYRRGGVNSAPACGPGVTKNCLAEDELIFKPDRTRNYELGIKSTWFDKRLLVNADLYYVRWTDLRLFTANKFGVDYTVNGSQAVSKGVELQFQGELPGHLSLLGTFTYDDAHLTEPAPNLVSDRNGTYDAEPGDRLPITSKTMGSLNLRWTHHLESGYTFAASYGVSAQGNSYSSIGLRASGEIIPGYAVHNASLDLSKNNWNVTFFVDNVTNKYAYTAMEVDRSWQGLVLNGFSTRSYFHSILPPRLFGLEAYMHFGSR
jgi:iron complex outermembrane recepter protein